MGVIYCSKCRKVVPPGGVDDGLHYLVGDQPVCPDCYRQIPEEERTGDTVAKLDEVRERSPTSRLNLKAVGRPSGKKASSRRLARQSRKPGGRAFLVAVLVVLAIVAGVVIARFKHW